MRTGLPRWPLAAGAALALALLAFLWPARQAGAHAVLERSLPIQGQQLPQAPDVVEVWFSEQLERSLTELSVLDTAGNPVDTGTTEFSDDPKYASIALQPDVGPGVYTVTYQNVSTVDGHQWSGAFSFIVLLPDGSVPNETAFVTPEAKGQGFLPGVGDGTLRWLALLAAAALAGSTMFYLLVARPAAAFLTQDEEERVGEAAMVVAAAAVVISVPVLLVAMVGQLLLLADRLGGLDNVTSILFDTRTGQLWLSRAGICLALLLVFAPALSNKAYRAGSRAALIVGVALVGALGLLMTFSLNSHAEAGGGAFWAVGSDFVHFAATAAWMGALLQLPLVFWWSRNRLGEDKRLLYLANVLDRFSWLAVVSVVLLLGTGVFNGFVQLPTLESLWDTTYGRVLIVKLALILPLLGVAAMNAVFLKPALVAAIDELHAEDASERPSGETARRSQRRLDKIRRALPVTTLLELALAAFVIASVSILTQSTTAQGELRLDAGKPAGDEEFQGQSRNIEVDLGIDPFGLSLSTYTVTLVPLNDEPLGEVLAVNLIASFNDPNAPPSAGRTGTRQPLEPTDRPDVWQAEAALLTQPGDWAIETRVQRRGLDDEQVIITVPRVGGILADRDQPQDLFDLPFTSVDWNMVAGGAMVAMGLGVFLIWRNRPSSWQPSTALSVGVASLIALIAGATLLFGIDVHHPDLSTKSPVPPTRANLALGKEIFDANCTACHGITGEGDGPAAGSLPVQPPRFGDHVPYHNDLTLYTWITEGIERDGRRNMPTFREILSDDERWTVVTFLRNTFSTGVFEFILPDEPTPTLPPGG